MEMMDTLMDGKSDFNFRIPTVIAREIKGSTPEWYDPNGYYRFVKIVNGVTGETFTVDLDVVSKYNTENMSPAERWEFLKQARVDDSLLERSSPVQTFNNRSDQMLRNSRNVNPPVFLPQNKGIKKPIANPVEERPELQVIFKIKGVPAKFTCVYHDVIILENCLILVQDFRLSAAQQLEVDPGTEVQITIPDKNIREVNCISSGLIFEYDGRQFNVLVYKTEEPPQPKTAVDDLDSKFPEVVAREEPEPDDFIDSLSELEKE